MCLLRLTQIEVSEYHSMGLTTMSLQAAKSQLGAPKAKLDVAAVTRPAAQVPQVRMLLANAPLDFSCGTLVSLSFLQLP